MSLYNPEKFDEYFSRPSSGKVVQNRLDYYSFVELPKYDIREKIKYIDIPSIIYCGKFDSQCPLDYSKEINTLIPTSKLYIFDRSNHSPFLEEKESFCEMVKEFYELKT
jgi:proline iminopeptidase